MVDGDMFVDVVLLINHEDGSIAFVAMLEFAMK